MTRSVPFLCAATLAAVTALSPARAGAAGPPECVPACAELPAMQQQLFQQELLQARFKKYLDYDIVPSPQMVPDPERPGKKVLETMIDAMQRDAAEALARHMASPAGGGTAGSAAAAAGTTDSCEIKLIQGEKVSAFDEASYRKTHRCWDADFLIAHEQQHVADCKAGVKINADYHSYAASDVRAYGVGVRALRRHIAGTARRCGWKGSTRPDRKNPVDQRDQAVVPTPAEVQQLVDALKSGRRK